MLFLTEITLNTKKLHNLQNSQVMSDKDDHTCALANTLTVKSQSADKNSCFQENTNCIL